MLTTIENKVRQPSTLMALGVLAAAVVYWITGNAAFAGIAAAAVMGTVDDHTAGLISKIEGLEDSLHNQSKGV